MALSSTEAELYALAEAGKMLLYVRNILEGLGYEQHISSTIHEDNQGCLLISQSQRPTKRVKHIDTRHFAVLDWVEKDLLSIQKIATSDNAADTLTKPLHRILFNRHTDTILGHRRPAYVTTK